MTLVRFIATSVLIALLGLYSACSSSPEPPSRSDPTVEGANREPTGEQCFVDGRNLSLESAARDFYQRLYPVDRQEL